MLCLNLDFLAGFVAFTALTIGIVFLKSLCNQSRRIVFSDLLNEIENAFSGLDRAEPVVRAERLNTVFDFTGFFNPLGIPLDRVSKSACFLFTKLGGRTVIRSKKHSHLLAWEDDGTVSLFHVSISCIAFTVLVM